MLWKRVDRRYLTYLRLYQVLFLVIVLVGLAFSYWLEFIRSPVLAGSVAVLVLIVFGELQSSAIS